MQQLVQVLVDVLLDIGSGGESMSPQMVGSTVKDIIADGLATELPVRHRGREDTVAKAMVTEAITQSSPLPLQPDRAPEVVLH